MRPTDSAFKLGTSAGYLDSYDQTTIAIALDPRVTLACPLAEFAGLDALEPAHIDSPATEG